jgi:cellulose synthase/poly-beta-1,6-N-acetylglucosamine synthase-like glycosyltransferase
MDVASVFNILLVVLTAAYAAGIFFIASGLLKLKPLQNKTLYDISVVIAARNEEKHIGDVLTALIGQDYPKDRYEIIVVDDESTDGTAHIVAQFEKDNPSIRIRLLHASDRLRIATPKKNALQLGINRATGEIIALTDADCCPPTTWLSTLVACFEPDIGLAIGFSPYELPKLKSLFDYFQALDALALAAIAAGTTALGFPATCNGRNLAYRKAVYQQVGGFDKISQFVSGDDDLFLRLIVNQTSWRVHYALDSRAAVPTYLLDSGAKFFHQRVRHASKGFHYGIKMTFTLSALFLYIVLLFLGLPATLAIPAISTAVVGSFLIKIFADFILLVIFAKRMDRLRYLKAYPLVALFHIPYIVVFGALGQFVKFQWKRS